MGICLSLLVFDERPNDAPASRLTRALDALRAWAPASAFAIEAPRASAQVERRGPGRWSASHAAPLASELGSTFEEVRATAAASTDPSLEVLVASPIGPLWVTAAPTPNLDPNERVAFRQYTGDVRLYLDKIGRRFFEDPLYASDEDDRIEAELGLARAEPNAAWKIPELHRARAALRARNASVRSALVVSLYEAFARRFGARSVRAHLDHLASVAPHSSLLYYRDAQALCDDVALVAVMAEHWYGRQSKARSHSMASILGDMVYGRDRVAEADVAPLLARLRSLGPAEARRAIETSPFAAPLAEGFLLGRAALVPVGETLAPFFESLIG